MGLHDFGTLIWAILIIIAVISSLTRSARRTISSAQRQQQNTQPAQRTAPTPPQVRTLTPQRTYVPPPVPPVIKTVSETVRAETRGVERPERLRGVVSQARGRRGQTGVFGKGDSVTRGIIALEVLGPPRALREWSAGFPT